LRLLVIHALCKLKRCEVKRNSMEFTKHLTQPEATMEKKHFCKINIHRKITRNENKNRLRQGNKEEHDTFNSRNQRISIREFIT